MKGFTLIELAIVLVIIGLLIAGVLTGRELVRTAKSNKIVSDITELEQAINTFRAKYGFLPGDNGEKAFAFGLQDAIHGTCDSNSPVEYSCKNNIIEGGGGEVSEMWQNLYVSGLYTNVDTALWMSGKIYRNNIFMIPMVNNTSSSDILAGTFVSILTQNGDGVTCSSDGCPGSSTYETYFIDSKRDDGLPLTGNVRAVGEHTDGLILSTDLPIEGASGEASAVCVSNDTTPFEYNLENESEALCLPLVKLYM